MLGFLGEHFQAHGPRPAGTWRFELFYYDYSVGVLVAAIIAAYTFGSMGNELSFSDNLLVAGKRNMAYAVAAGMVFNLANMLLVAAISVAGLAVAFPGRNRTGAGDRSPLELFPQSARQPAAARRGRDAGYVRHHRGCAGYTAHAKPAKPAPGRPRQSKPATSRKGILLSLISGVLMGSFYPLVEMGKGGGVDSAGLGPYAVAFLFALGVFFSTFIYNLYFLNLPVEGQPLSMLAYFKGTLRATRAGDYGWHRLVYRSHRQLRGRQRSAQSSSRARDQLRNRAGRNHGERTVGRFGVERIRGRARQCQNPADADVRIVFGGVDVSRDSAAIRPIGPLHAANQESPQRFLARQTSLRYGWIPAAASAQLG